MAANPTPENDDMLLALAEDMADGLHELEVPIGVKQNTEAAMRASITAATSARQALATAEQTETNTATARRNADTASKTVLRNCQIRFRKLYGGRYNAQWSLTGWPPGSIRVPDSQDRRFTLLNSLKNFFTANPTAESVEGEATSALCGAAHTAISDARAAENTAGTQVKLKKSDEEAAFKALRKRVRGTIEEIGKLIPADDPRWETFGLNIPANPSTPLSIGGVTLTMLGGGKVLVSWTYAKRMTDTRLRVKRVGIDEDFKAAGTSEGLEKTLEGFTPGQVIEVIAIAYNDGGDAPPSPMATGTVS